MCFCLAPKVWGKGRKNKLQNDNKEEALGNMDFKFKCASCHFKWIWRRPRTVRISNCCRWSNCYQPKPAIYESSQKLCVPKLFLFLFTKGCSFLVWYSIDRGIQENESILCVKNIFVEKTASMKNQNKW